MIKLPKEISKVLKKLGDAGFEAYAMGCCVRDSILGKSPLDWDISTNARLDDMRAIFPEAKVLDKALHVIRMEYSDAGGDGGITVDVSVFRDRSPSNGPASLEILFVTDLRRDLEGRDFTINAMADNPVKRFVDPFEGRQDIKEKLVRTIGDPATRFEEQPILMMRAIRTAAELDFDLPKQMHQAIVEKASLLENADIREIRSEFEAILTAEHAGKGLRMLAASDLIPMIVGDMATKMTTRQVDLFNGLADGIDKTKKKLDRSLGLFFQCFEKEGRNAIERLQYDGALYQHLIDALTQVEAVFFLADKMELKQYIASVGMDRYGYLHNLAKAQHLVYGKNDFKVENREHIMKEIEKNKEPLFVEDLAIDGNDIIEAGIADGDKAGELLGMLVDVVHRYPNKNNREDLLIYAKKFKKSRLRSIFRKVKWLR